MGKPSEQHSIQLRMTPEQYNAAKAKQRLDLGMSLSAVLKRIYWTGIYDRTKLMPKPIVRPMKAHWIALNGEDWEALSSICRSSSFVERNLGTPAKLLNAALQYGFDKETE